MATVMKGTGEPVGKHVGKPIPLGSGPDVVPHPQRPTRLAHDAEEEEEDSVAILMSPTPAAAISGPTVDATSAVADMDVDPFDLGSRMHRSESDSSTDEEDWEAIGPQALHSQSYSNGFSVGASPSSFGRPRLSFSTNATVSPRPALGSSPLRPIHASSFKGSMSYSRSHGPSSAHSASSPATGATTHSSSPGSITFAKHRVSTRSPLLKASSGSAIVSEPPSPSSLAPITIGTGQPASRGGSISAAKMRRKSSNTGRVSALSRGLASLGTSDVKVAMTDGSVPRRQSGQLGKGDDSAAAAEAMLLLSGK